MYFSKMIQLTIACMALALEATIISNSANLPNTCVNIADIALIKSVVDPFTINEFVKQSYPFENVVKTEILSIGVNDIYLVEIDDQKYVLRLSRVDKYLTMSESEFVFELEWLHYLNLKDVPVSYPIRRLDNHFCSLFQAPEGPRFASLFTYGEGTTDLNLDQAYLLGAALAKLHVVSDSFDTPLNRAHLDISNLFHITQQIKDFLSNELDKEWPHLDQLTIELEDQILSLEMTKGSYGIIAGDVHGYNQHFDVNNKLTMFDFEFCAFGYRMYDLATFKWGRCDDNMELWEAFLKGYKSFRPLTESELQSIDVFVKARHLWWMGTMTTLKEYRYKLDWEFWENAFAYFQI